MNISDPNFEPPRFAGLVWRQRDGGTWIDADIDANPEFWRWWRAGQRKLPNVGVYVTKIYGDWCVIFNPAHCGGLSDLERVIADICADVAQMPKILLDGHAPESASQAAQALHDREAIRNCKWAVERGLEIQADAEALLAEWGDFASDVRRLREIVSTAPTALLSTYARTEITAARRKTERRASVRLAKARLEVDAGGAETVDWSDDEVIRAVRFLTSSDFDHASIANDRGWSSSDSAAGHWCAKMLIDHAHGQTALKAARQLVGKYTRQLTIAGIIRRAA